MSANEIKFNGETIGITQVNYKKGDAVMHPKIIKYQEGDDDVNAKVVWREPYNLNIIKDDSITSIKYKIDGGTPVETFTSTDVTIGYGQKYSYIVTYDKNTYSNILKNDRPAETWEDAKEYEMTEDVTINPKVVPYKKVLFSGDSGSGVSITKVTRTSHISNYDIENTALSSGDKIYAGDTIKVEISIASDDYGVYKLLDSETKVNVGSEEVSSYTTYYITKNTSTSWKTTSNKNQSSQIEVYKSATVSLTDEKFDSIIITSKSASVSYKTVYWGDDKPQTGWTRDGEGEMNVLTGVESAVNYIPLTHIKVNGFVYYGSSADGNSHQLGDNPLTVEGLSTGDFTIKYGGYKWTFSVSQKSGGSSTLVLKRTPPKPKGEYKSIAKLTVYQYPQ